MLTLHTGLFARMFTVLAVIGLVMGGVSVEAMPQVANASHDALALHVSGDKHHHADGVSHQDVALNTVLDTTCATADNVSNDCSVSNADEQCDSAGECCPHCVTALPVQIESNFGPLPTVQTATPQWRISSVTPVTEIRPPIYLS